MRDILRKGCVLSNADVRAILAAQPVLRMQRFAAMLGWRGLQLEHVRVDMLENHKLDGPAIVIYYTTTDRKFFLQINTHPHGQTRLHQATVIAWRYGMHSVGWHAFELFDEDQQLIAEGKRLEPLLARSLVKDRNWRRRFLNQHPEYALICGRNGRLASLAALKGYT